MTPTSPAERLREIADSPTFAPLIQGDQLRAIATDIEAREQTKDELITEILDMLNSWAREWGAPEVSSDAQATNLIDTLWTNANIYKIRSKQRHEDACNVFESGPCTCGFSPMRQRIAALEGALEHALGRECLNSSALHNAKRAEGC